MKLRPIIFACLLFSISTQAQEFRSSKGTPGSDYWQNASNYVMNVELNDVRHEINGMVLIDYTNNSPKPLQELWLHLDQNAFKKNSLSKELSKKDERFQSSDTEGMRIHTVIDQNNEKDLTAQISFKETLMKITLPKAIPGNGGKQLLSIYYSFEIPTYGCDRVGHDLIYDERVYSIAQWYPRMAVYDDLNGWDTRPYLGIGEFYADYGTFTYYITLPSDYIVAGSGELLNGKQVLKKKYLKKLENLNSKEITQITPEQETKKGITKTKKETNTWYFQMKNTRDVSWACSKGFDWSATLAEVGNNNKVKCMTYSVDGLDKEWKKGSTHIKNSLEFYSNQWFAYPYSSMSVVASNVGGIEYPALTFVPYERRGNAFWNTTDHEVAHNWFPMIIGSNERLHMWMDEGLVTFMGHYAAKNVDYSSYISEYRHTSSALAMSTACKSITAPDHYDCSASSFGEAMYFKPAFGYILLREWLIGPEKFDEIFSGFMEAWAFKHPAPEDFFNYFNYHSGQDFSWFWEDWLNSTKKLDFGFQSVTENNPREFTIKIKSHDEMLFPIPLHFEFADGTDDQLTLDRSIWNERKEASYVYKTNKKIRRIVIDKKFFLPDTNRENNFYRFN